MNITKLEQARRRKAISGILSSLIMFAMVFSVGIGFFVFVNSASFQSAQANQQKQQAFQQAAEERLSMRVGLSTMPDPWEQTGDLWLRVNNTGGSSVTMIDIFVTNTAVDRIASSSQVTPGTPYLATFSLAKQGDLNYSLPITILPGFSTAQLSGCGTTPGCDIAISKISYTYGGSPVVVSVLTSTGNIFSTQYPPTPGASTVTTTKTSTTTSIINGGSGNPGGNALIVQMIAAPPQTFGCTGCLTDTVTVYNYATSPVTGISLSPSVPLVSVTGVATASPYGTPPCNLIGGSSDLPAYSGSPAPKIVYVCTYSANANGYGGFASFTVQAIGALNGMPTTSGQAISNTVQIGGPVSVLNQGPFSANFFFFKYSACTNNAYPCSTTPSPVTFASLPTSGQLVGYSYYVAFYVNIINNFNVTLPILPYSFLFTDTTSGQDSSWYIVGDPGNTANPCNPCNPNLPYIPNYNPGGSGIPTLTPYPSTCIATSTASCIIVPSGGNVVVTFAACDIGSTWWNWGGSAYDAYHDSGNTCTTNAADYYGNGSSYVSIIITFVYKGQVYTQQIPFVGQTVT